MLNIDEKYFVKVCNESKTMCAAAAQLEMTLSTFTRKAKKLNCYKPNCGGKGIKKPKQPDGKNKYDLKDILNGKYPQYHSHKLHRRLIQEGIKEYKCELCGITEWNGKQLSFELHHKDGNCHNHLLKNLIILCPNCHSQEESHKRGGKFV